MAIGALGNLGPIFPTFGGGSAPLGLTAPPSAPTMDGATAVTFLQAVTGAMAQVQQGWSNALGDNPFGSLPAGVQANGTTLVNADDLRPSGNGDALGANPFGSLPAGVQANGTSLVNADDPRAAGTGTTTVVGPPVA